MGEPVYPIPAPLSVTDGLLVFEQLVTDEFERLSMVPARDVHIRQGKRVAAVHGLRFAGEGKVERSNASTELGLWRYRLTVPVTVV